MLTVCKRGIFIRAAGDKMLFFEYSFLFWFLPLTLVPYHAISQRWRNGWMLFSSCFFYAMSGWAFLALLLLCVLVNYRGGKAIGNTASPARRKGYLVLTLSIDLGMLGFFKYVGLLTRSLQQLFGESLIPSLDAPLPIGISFYTFQAMSYVIDLYRGETEPVKRLRDFALYLTFFPQLIAGPIIRFSGISSQFEAREHDLARFAGGLDLLIRGLAKKILVADTLALLSAPLFSAQNPGFIEAWTSMLMFGGQIYFDFAAYSDMAIGLGRLFGFELPRNFNSPYQAESFGDFWRRWHITLSTWLRDYLYIPLGGNWGSAAGTCRNLMLTMMLGGLWHGASWNFLLWGSAHGLLLVLERLLRPYVTFRVPKLVKRIAVYLVVTMVWVPFKFEHFERCLVWLKAMLAGSGSSGSISLPQLVGLLGLLALVFRPTRLGRDECKFGPRETAYAVSLFLVSLLVGYGRVEASPFLYFRF